MVVGEMDRRPRQSCRRDLSRLAGTERGHLSLLPNAVAVFFWTALLIGSAWAADFVAPRVFTAPSTLPPAKSFYNPINLRAAANMRVGNSPNHDSNNIRRQQRQEVGELDSDPGSAIAEMLGMSPRSDSPMDQLLAQFTQGTQGQQQNAEALGLQAIIAQMMKESAQAHVQTQNGASASSNNEGFFANIQLAMAYLLAPLIVIMDQLTAGIRDVPKEGDSDYETYQAQLEQGLIPLVGGSQNTQMGLKKKLWQEKIKQVKEGYLDPKSYKLIKYDECEVWKEPPPWWNENPPAYMAYPPPWMNEAFIKAHLRKDENSLKRFINTATSPAPADDSSTVSLLQLPAEAEENPRAANWTVISKSKPASSADMLSSIVKNNQKVASHLQELIGLLHNVRSLLSIDPFHR